MGQELRGNYTLWRRYETVLRRTSDWGGGPGMSLGIQTGRGWHLSVLERGTPGVSAAGERLSLPLSLRETETGKEGEKVLAAPAPFPAHEVHLGSGFESCPSEQIRSQ